MRRILLTAAVIALVFAAASATGSHPVQAQIPIDMSHLKIVTGTSHGGDHVDTVTNGDIDVRITIHDNYTDLTDWGTLALRPGSTPEFAWTCNSCLSGYFNNVVACDQAGGCESGDVNGWLVGVKVNVALLSQVSYVNYFVSSDWMGDGYRYHPNPPDCNTAVSPMDDTYSETDNRAGWDVYTYCTDSGVVMTLAYE